MSPDMLLLAIAGPQEQKRGILQNGPPSISEDFSAGSSPLFILPFPHCQDMFFQTVSKLLWGEPEALILSRMPLIPDDAFPTHLLCRLCFELPLHRSIVHRDTLARLCIPELLLFPWSSWNNLVAFFYISPVLSLMWSSFILVVPCPRREGTHEKLHYLCWLSAKLGRITLAIYSEVYLLGQRSLQFTESELSLVIYCLPRCWM